MLKLNITRRWRVIQLPEGYVQPKPSIISEKYVVGALVGEGCWGKVYLARDKLASQDGAIKVLDPNSIAREQMLTRGLSLDEVVFRETRGCEVACSGVVERHYERDSTGKPFVWMPGEYIKTLRQHRASLSRLYENIKPSEEELIEDIKEWLMILSGTFVGLSEIHSKLGITHGDISPSNILLDKRGNSFIADFGSSSLVPSSDWSNLPRDNVGHKSIRAPELYYNRSHQTPKTDVYSMGSVLFYAIVGREPRALGTLNFPDYEERMRNIREVDADGEIEEESAFLPKGLRALFRRSMTFNPHRRHFDGVELNNDFLESSYKTLINFLDS